MFGLSRVSAAAAVLLVACGHRGPPQTDESWYEELPPSDPLVGYSAAFALTWQGARIGGAVEELAPSPRPAESASRSPATAGLRFTRRESIVIRRGDAVVPYETAIAVDTDDTLVAREVRVRMMAGGNRTEGRARRAPDGSWIVRFGDGAPRRAPAEAVPAELVPLLVARSPERVFSGQVLLTGHGFSVASMRVAPVVEPGEEASRRRVIAVTETALGELQSEVDLAADGTVLRVEAPNNVSAVRVDPRSLDDPFDPPEVVDNASISVAGAAPRSGPVALSVDSVQRDAPPALPGQLVVAEGDHWTVLLTRGDEGGSHAEPSVAEAVDPEISALATAIVRATAAVNERDVVRALTQATARLLDDDLSSPAVEPSVALALGRGDCTAHAALFAALASARGIPTRLVTGYRLTGARLVRHRWALAFVDDRWIAVDPTYGEMPTRPGLLGLAVHRPSAAELAVVDDIAFAGLARARVRFVER